MTVKRFVDVSMTVLLIFLINYQMTEQEAHEWLGVAMLLVLLLHQGLEYRWYMGLLRGKWNATRALMTTVNIALLAAFLLTGISGVIMSQYAVPFAHSDTWLSWARQTHLTCSFWSFILTGVHVGLHWGMIAGRLPDNRTGKISAMLLSMLVAGWGFALFAKSDIPDALFLRTHFIFLDYDKAALLTLIETLAQLSAWVLLGYQILRLVSGINARQRRLILRQVMSLTGALLFALIFYLYYASTTLPQW